MDVIEFLREEALHIRKLLQRLLTNCRFWTRDEVFDRVREVCDATMVHLEKQRHLLLEHVAEHQSMNNELHQTQKEISSVEDELGRLVEVHVDEPEYESCLNALLNRLVQHARVSEDLYDVVRKTLGNEEMAAINEGFKSHIFQSGFSSDAMTSHPGVRDVSVHDRL